MVYFWSDDAEVDTPVCLPVEQSNVTAFHIKVSMTPLLVHFLEI